MKITNTRQINKLRKLIESKVRKFINEEYDPVDTVWKDSDELDHNNPYDNARIGQEMDADWDELDRINNRFNSSKNPVLASKYNHNVEDGREEAEAYANSLFEAKIQRMVREALNEYGDTERGQEKLGALSARKHNNGEHTASAEVCGYADDARRKEWSKSSKDKNAMKRQKSLRNAFDDGQEKMWKK